MARGILVPPPGTYLAPPALEAQSLNHWTTREVPKLVFKLWRDFPGGPVVKNPPSSAGDPGLIPRRETKIECAAGQLSPRTATTEPACSGAHAPQLERNPRAATQT